MLPLPNKAFYFDYLVGKVLNIDDFTAKVELLRLSYMDHKDDLGKSYMFLCPEIQATIEISGIICLCYDGGIATISSDVSVFLLIIGGLILLGCLRP